MLLPPAPIEEIAWKIGIGVDELIPMGRGMAKITWDGLKSKFEPQEVPMY